MPVQEFGAWFILRGLRQIYLISMKKFIMLAVIKLLFNPIAHFKTMIICNSDIAGIEKPMDIGPQEKAIAY